MEITKIQLAGIIAAQFRTMEALSGEIRDLIDIIKDTPDNDHEKRLTGMLKRLEEITGADKVHP